MNLTFRRFAAIVFTACALIFFVAIPQARAGNVGIATGNSTLTYYKIGNDIRSMCGSKDLNINVYESSGTLNNIERVLEDKRTQYAIVQADGLAFKSREDKKTRDKIKMIMPLYDEEIHLVATVASGIRSDKDLNGKRVVIGTQGSGNWVTSQVIKAEANMDWQDIEVTAAEGMTQMLLGQADAMIVVAGKPASLLQNIGAGAKGKLRIVPMINPALANVYSQSYITEGMYDFSPNRVNTYAVKAILVTYDFKSQYQADITSLTSCISNNLSKLQDSGHAKWRQVDPSSYRQVQWPVHPAAERFLKKVK
jgi:TRAP transporter TAXI family solute receptor